MRFPNEVVTTSQFKAYKRQVAKAVEAALGSRGEDWINEQLEHSNELRLGTGLRTF
jgi:hypothetical protein